MFTSSLTRLPPLLFSLDKSQKNKYLFSRHGPFSWGRKLVDTLYFVKVQETPPPHSVIRQPSAIYIYM